VKAEDEGIKEDGQVMHVLDGCRSGGDNLIDIVEVDSTGKQQDDEQDARDFLVMLIERIGDRLDLLPRPPSSARGPAMTERIPIR
jgi:hypothetical protein